MKQIKIERQPQPPQPPPENKTRNALIIGGSILGGAAVLAGYAHSGIKRQKKIFEEVSIKNRREAFKEANKKVAEALKPPKVKDVTDPYRSALADRLQIASLAGRINVQTSHSDYPQHIKAGLEKAFEPIGEAAEWTQVHGSEKAQKLVHGTRIKRLDDYIEGLAKQRTEAGHEQAAWRQHHENVVRPFMVTANKTVREFPHRQHYVYHAGERRVVDTRIPEYTHLRPGGGAPAEMPLHTTTAAGAELPEKPVIQGNLPPQMSENIMESGTVEDVRKAIQKRTNEKLKKQQGKAKGKKKGLARLVKLIELDVRLNEGRDPSGKFTSGGAEGLPDANSMQYAYHAPLVQQPQQPGPRGPGRPPGSLNKRTIETRRVYEEAVGQQPEMQQQQPQKESHLLRNTLIAAGGLAGAATILGPKLAKPIGELVSENKFVSRVEERIGTPIKTRYGSEKIFGTTMVEKAVASGRTPTTAVQEDIRAKLQGFRAARGARLQKAAAWAKAHPLAPAGTNPHAPAHDPVTGISAFPPTAVSAAARKTKLEKEVIEGKFQTAEQKNLVLQKTAEVTRLEGEVDKWKKNADKIKVKHGALSDKYKDAQAKLDETKEKLARARPIPTQHQQIQRAGAVTRTPDVDEAQNIIQTGALSPGVFDPRAKRPKHAQGEFFVTASAASSENQFPLVSPKGALHVTATEGGAAAERIARLKQQFLNTRGAEIAETVAQSAKYSDAPLTHDQVAEAMAIKHVKNLTTRYAPAPPLPPASATTAQLQEHEQRIADIQGQITSQDVATGQRAKEHVENAVADAAASFDAANGIKPKARIPKALRDQRQKVINDTAIEATHAITRQLVSEGRLPASMLTQIPLRGSTGKAYKASASELNFARRLHRRIQLDRESNERATLMRMQPLGPGMIELARGDQLMKLLPRTYLPRTAGDQLEDVLRKRIRPDISKTAEMLERRSQLTEGLVKAFKNRRKLLPPQRQFRFPG